MKKYYESRLEEVANLKKKQAHEKWLLENEEEFYKELKKIKKQEKGSEE